jgi:hypothetical protein
MERHIDFPDIFPSISTLNEALIDRKYYLYSFIMIHFDQNLNAGLLVFSS